MRDVKNSIHNLSRFTPWVVGAAAFLFYALTMVRDVVPGAPVRIINTVNGSYYLPILPHFLYSSVAKLAVWVLPGSVLFNLNLLSALFGALSIALFFNILLRMPMFKIRDKASPIPRHVPQTSKFIAILAASLFLIFSVPLWIASTRPDNHTFDLFLILSCFWMVLRYAEPKASARWLLASAFLYGLGITESATMIALSPLFGIAILLTLLYRHELNTTHVWPLIVLGLCGLLFYLVPVWSVGRLPSWGYQEYSGFTNTLVDLWRKQYVELRASFPRVGGLLVFLCAFAPWVYIYLVPRPDYGSNWLSHALTVVALAVLNVLGVAQLAERGLTPTMIMGFNAPFLLPYLAISSWMGYLAGYWWFRGSAPDSGSHEWLRFVWKSAAVLNLLIPFGIAGVNFVRFEPTRTSELTGLARNMVQSCQDRPIFIISKSVMDDLLRYAAFEKGTPRHVILIQDIERASYRRYLANILPEANIDTEAPSDVLKAIVSKNKKGPAGCALFNPDMALSIGYQFIPNGLVVWPTDAFSSQKPTEIFLRNLDYFDNVFAAQLQTQGADTTTNLAQRFVRQNYSRCANNVGVTMQLLKSDGLAERAYDLALRILPQNPSALLNQRAVYLRRAKQSDDPTQAASLNKQAQTLLERAQKEASSAPQLFRSSFLMAANYGYLYSEMFSLSLAQAARQSGQQDLESQAIEQARMINPDSLPVQIGSALLAQGKGNPAEAETQYRNILRAHPDNISARIGLAVLGHDTGNYDSAIQVIEENPALTNNVNAQSLRALLYLEKKDASRGQEIYKGMLTATNHTTLSASFIALAAWRLAQRDQAESFARKVLAVDPGNLPMIRLMAALAQQRGDLATALTYLKTLQEANPKEVPIRETIIRLSMQSKRNVDARKEAEDLLTTDPSNMVANLAMSSLTENPEIRVKYLRHCIENRTSPLYDTALNNLAYNLIAMNRCAEALPLAEEAVSLRPSNDKYHHTLAEIYKELGQYDKAMEQILLASTTAPDDPNHMLLQGEILMAQGENKKGANLIVKALPNLTGEWRERALKALKR